MQDIAGKSSKKIYILDTRHDIGLHQDVTFTSKQFQIIGIGVRDVYEGELLSEKDGKMQ